MSAFTRCWPLTPAVSSCARWLYPNPDILLGCVGGCKVCAPRGAVHTVPVRPSQAPATRFVPARSSRHVFGTRESPQTHVIDVIWISRHSLSCELACPAASTDSVGCGCGEGCSVDGCGCRGQAQNLPRLAVQVPQYGTTVHLELWPENGESPNRTPARRGCATALDKFGTIPPFVARFPRS